MPYNVLLVDDDREFREELAECLEDYRVIEASTGSEALELLGRPNEIDIIILDVMMPGRKGTDVLTEIKRREPDLAVIMLTGHSSKDVAIASLRGDADDYIEKPVDIDLLLESIRRLLHGRGAAGTEFASDADGKIERAKDFLDRNYHKRVSLENVAELVCLSPKYLSRLFKEKTGSGFNEYRLRRKMEKAGETLRETGLTVNEISYRLGYRNMESFIRMFKKINGMTPTEFRETAENASDGPSGGAGGAGSSISGTGD
jgi:two-component system response regulator YesN